jgi:hypothetical protein
MTEAEREEKYKRLEEQLEQHQSWPGVYMFKFIIPADNRKLSQVENLFNSEESEVTIRQSKKGNFISITAKELMLSPAKIIERYRMAEGIEGLMSL